MTLNLLRISASSIEALKNKIDLINKHLSQNKSIGGIFENDLTCDENKRYFSAIFDDLSELKQQINHFISKKTHKHEGKKKVSFIYPSQGSLIYGSLYALRHNKIVKTIIKEHLNNINEEKKFNTDLIDKMLFSKKPIDEENQYTGAHMQIALFLFQQLYTHILLQAGIVCDSTIGHSAGELSALALTKSNGNLIHKLLAIKAHTCIQFNADESLYALRCTRKELTFILQNYSRNALQLAVINTNDSFMVAIKKKFADDICHEIKKRPSCFLKKVNISQPFHTKFLNKTLRHIKANTHYTTTKKNKHNKCQLISTFKHVHLNMNNAISWLKTQLTQTLNFKRLIKQLHYSEKKTPSIWIEIGLNEKTCQLIHRQHPADKHPSDKHPSDKHPSNHKNITSYKHDEDFIENIIKDLLKLDNNNIHIDWLKVKDLIGVNVN